MDDTIVQSNSAKRSSIPESGTISFENGTSSSLVDSSFADDKNEIISDTCDLQTKGTPQKKEDKERKEQRKEVVHEETGSRVDGSAVRHDCMDDECGFASDAIDTSHSTSVTVDWRLKNLDVFKTRSSSASNNWVLADKYGVIDSSLMDNDLDRFVAPPDSSGLVDLLCGLYAIFAIIFGCVLTLANALTKNLDEESYYLQAFSVYIHSVSILFLSYLLFYVLQNSTKSKRIECEDKSNISSTAYNLSHDVDAVAINHLNRSSIEVFPHPEHIKSQSAIEFPEQKERSNSQDRSISYGAPGVNFYLRLGAIGFGTGSMVQDGFRLVQFISNDQMTSHGCRGPFNVVTVVLHVMFVFLQTFFIFKYHKVALNVFKSALRLGFLHTVAANVYVWFATTVAECQRELSTISNHNDTLLLHENENIQGAGNNGTPRCDQQSLVWKASPFLFPCTIEYSLIAAAVAYKLYRSIGCRTSESQSSETIAIASISASSGGDVHLHGQGSGEESVNCNKANKGLFVGLLVIVLTTIAVSSYFVFGEHLNSFYGDHSSSILYFGTEILLLFVSFVGVVVACFKFQFLERSTAEEHSTSLDSSLLFISVCGVFSLEGFHLVSSLGTMTFGDAVTVLAFGGSVLAISQSVFQTIFVADALRRRARNQEQVDEKPGRAVIMFLLLCNLSLWIVCIFEVKKAENLPIHYNFYGSRPWNIIRLLCVPLIIFFRFHSTVCLSEIWVNAYSMRQRPKRLIDQKTNTLSST